MTQRSFILVELTQLIYPRSILTVRNFENELKELMPPVYLAIKTSAVQVVNYGGVWAYNIPVENAHIISCPRSKNNAIGITAKAEIGRLKIVKLPDREFQKTFQ